MCIEIDKRDKRGKWLRVVANASLAVGLLLWSFARPMLGSGQPWGRSWGQPWAQPWERACFDAIVGLLMGLSIGMNLMLVWKARRRCVPEPKEL